MSAIGIIDRPTTSDAGRCQANPPAVSVLMPAYNREKYIAAAIESIVAQSFRDWELIVIDDGSTDRTAEISAGFSDPRIRVVRLGRNGGIARARNRGLAEASGQYIAWLDSDDIAKPRRLARQVAFLRRNPEVALVGSCARKIDDAGRRLPGIRVPPMTHDDIDCRQLLTSSFQQSSLMGRAEVLKAYPYDASFDVCEDVDVCVRITQSHRTRNLAEVLIDRRMHKAQLSREQKHKILSAQLQISRPLFDRLGWAISDDELIRLCALSRVPDRRPTVDDLAWAEDALDRLLSANARSQRMPREALQAFASLLMFDRYRRYSRGRALKALATSRFARGLVSPHSLSWFVAASSAILR